MKTMFWLIAAFLMTVSVFAQTEKNNYVFKVNDTEIGVYGGIGGRYSTTLNADHAGFMDFKGAVVFDGEWGVGFIGSGLYYDKKLSSLVNDGTYHFYASYGGVFVERIFSLNNNFKISLSIASGAGEAWYEYDKDFHKEKIWSEEIIDKTTFAIFEPAIEIQHRISGNWWIGVNGSYRNTSPLTMIETDENLLRKFSGGIMFKWGIF
jgi:hypothetical protein